MSLVRLSPFAAAMFLAGCGSTASILPTPGPSHYRIFFDESKSVFEKQKALWPHEAIHLADRLQYGDAIEINLIHARTGDAAPLYEDQIPIFDQNAIRTDQERAKRDLYRVRREAKQAMAEAIHPPAKLHVKATDVFGAFDRFRPDPGRQNVILIFSDALESADPKLNLEHVCLSQSDPPTLIADLARRRHWHSQSLAGANVVFILPAVDSNDAKNCNDSSQLRRFYSMLIEAMGGKLVDFNTYWNQP